MHEHEATPGSPEYLAQFLHPEKMLGLPPRHRPLDEVADVFPGGGAALVARVRERCAERVRAAAAELLAEPAVADAVARLPFAPGERVVAFGDSLTNDLQSWAQLLAELLAQARPDDEIEVVNLGRSDDTSANLLQRFAFVAAEQPAWVILLLGVNDAKHARLAPTVPLVSPRETRRNAGALAAMAADAGARTLWMIPPELDMELLARSPFVTGAPVSWNAADVKATRAALLETCEAPLDLAEAFAAVDAGEALRLDDGIHPSLAGQCAIVRALCARLAAR